MAFFKRRPFNIKEMKTMEKELIVCDNFGKQVQIGDIIVFVE